MQARLQMSVAPPLDGLRSIYNEIRRFFRGGRCESATSVVNLQPAYTVLEEKRDDTDVIVWPGATNQTTLCVFHRDRWIVDHAELGRAADALTRERSEREIHADFQRLQEIKSDLLELVKGLFHVGAEAW